MAHGQPRRCLMGLDGVELVMEVEEAFAIQISDAEAGSIRTPGQLIGLILERIAEPSQLRCRSLVAFNRLRSVLVHQLGVDRRSVRLEAEIQSFVPARSRGQFWRRLGAALPHDAWPRLRPSPWSGWVMGLLWLSTLISVFCGFPWQLSLVLVLTSTGGVLVMNSRALSPPISDRIFTEMPEHFSTVHQLIPLMLVDKATGWNRESVREKVREIVVAQLTLKPGEYHENADFGRDLGLS